MKTKLQITIAVNLRRAKSFPVKAQIQHIIDFNKLIIENESVEDYKVKVLAIKVVK